MMDVQQFCISGRLPSLNDYVNECRKHPQAGAALKRKAQKMVTDAIMDEGIRPMETPITVDCIWCEPNTRRDKDNIRSGVKYILDGLVKAGIIPDDGWKHVKDITDFYEVDKKNPRVLVTLIGPIKDDKDDPQNM